MSRRRKPQSRKPRPKPKPQPQSLEPQLALLIEADREIWRANIGLRGAIAMRDYLEMKRNIPAQSGAVQKGNHR